MPRIDDPKLKRVTRRNVKPKPKPKYTPPPSRSDAAQRTGAKTPTPPRPKVQLDERPKPDSATLNEIARRRIREAANRSGPPTPVKRAPEKHDADLTLGKSGRKRRRRQRKITEQAVKDLFKARSRQRQTAARMALERLGYLPSAPEPEPEETRKVEARTLPGMGARKVPYLNGKRAYEVDGKLTTQRPDTKFDDALGDAVKAVSKGASRAFGDKSRSTRAGFLPDLPAPAKRAAAKGVLAGGKSALGAVGSALDRPSAAVEAAIGKGLVKTGAIKDDKPGDVGKKIKRARGPLEAFVKGRRHGKDVSGSDIVQGVGAPREFGLPLTLVTDPLMWTGVGALPKAAAQRSAALAARIEHKSPEALREALRSRKVAGAADRASKTGDSDALFAALKEVADEHGISTRALGRTKRERQAKRAAAREQRSERSAESRQILEDVRAGKAGEVAPGTYVPDVAGIKATESVAKLAKQHEVRPGFRVRAVLPTGREIASLPVPLPGGFRVPTFLGDRAKKSLGIQRIQDARHDEVKIHSAALAELDSKRRTAEAVERGERLNIIDDMERNLRESMAGRTTKARDRIKESLDTGIGMQSLDEIAERFNRRKMLRTVAPSANQFGRMSQQSFQKQVMDAIETNLGPHAAKGRAAQIEKIQLHRWARADTGSQSILKKAGIKLTPAERKVMSDLDNVDKQMARYGQNVGTLNRALEDYGGFRMWENAEDLDQTIKTMSARMGGGGAFSKHRGFAAVSDLADPARMAALIKQHSAKDLTDEQARSLADEWHNTGTVRLAQEQMIRANQRGQDLPLDPRTDDPGLPGTYIRSVKLGERRDVPMFETNAPMAPGIARQPRSEAAMKEYGFPTLYPGEMELTDALRSATINRDQMRHVLRTTKSGTKTWRDHKKWTKRLDNEINALNREIAARNVGREDMLDAELAQLEDATEQLQQARAMYPDDPDVSAALDDLENQIAAKQAQLNEQEMLNREFSDIEGAPLESRARLDAEIDRILDEGGGNPFDDVAEDVTSRLPDFRRADEFPVTDMRKSYFYRTRSEAVNAAFRTRWRAIDGTEGRSVDDAEQTYKANDGTEGLVRDLERWQMGKGQGDQRTLEEQYDELMANVEELEELRLQNPEQAAEINDEISGLGTQLFDLEQQMKQRGLATEDDVVMWYDRAQDRVFTGDELTQSPPSLVPNSDRTIFWDLHTGREYVWPHRMDSAVGESVSRVIQPLNPDGKVNYRRVWPSDVMHAAEIEAKRGGDYDIVFKTGMEKGLGRVLSLSRYSVTSLFPAYHVRNMISDLLKSMQADSGVMFHPIANAKMAALAFGKGKGRDITIKGLGTMKGEDFLLMADTFGLRSGHHVAEVSRLADTGKFPERSKARRIVGKAGLGPSAGIGKTAVDLGIAREDVTRFLTFAQRMRANGGDAADAMLYMTKHHFDYNDLTINERRVVRNLFLFYTWYRKNIPLQLMELAHRPGFFAGVAHTYNALEQGDSPINQDYSKINPMFPDLSGKMPRRGTIPDYLKDRLSSVGVNWNGHAAMFGFGAPWSDLSLVKASPEGVRDWAAMMNPVFTTGYQIAAKEDLLTGREFTTQEAGGPATVLDSIAEALGMGELQKDEKGRPVLPWAAHVALRNIVPGFGRAAGAFEVPSATRDPGRLQSLGKKLNPIHGINVYMAPKPGSTREELAVTNQVKGRAAERRELNEKTYNLPDPERERLIKQFDLETLRWLKERGIPRKYLYTTKQSGFYRRKPRSSAGSGLGGGGGVGGNLSGGGGLGD